tara:strand:+ start:304 stop:1284 length:981 start_codon:yes stop_codon:yes gene_type:complete
VKNALKILILVFLFSCSKRVASVDFEYVYIYTSLEDKALLENVISEVLFNDIYYTPEAESRYQPIWKTHQDFLNKPNHSKLMFISLSEPLDTTIDVISNHLSQTISSKKNIFLIEDYFNNEQELIFLNYKDINALNNDLLYHRDWILSIFDYNEKSNMEKVAYRAGTDDNLSSKINEIFNVKMRVPIDYQIIKYDTLSNYIWLGRGFPYRWIFLFEDLEDYYINPGLAWSRLEDKFNDILDVEIFDYGAGFKNDPIKLKGVYGTKLTSENATGGPFFSNIITSDGTDKVLVASGFVNFPGKSKVFHIKELEYILSNIKYKGGYQNE